MNNTNQAKEDLQSGLNDNNTGILNISKVRPEIEKVINNIPPQKGWLSKFRRNINVY
jgi:hypothetical protein